MAASILDSVMGMLGPQVIGPVASQLGESTDTVQRGLQAGSAAMLAGLAAKASQPGFMGQIFGLITNPANSAGALSGMTSNLSSLASSVTSPIGNLGSQFVSSIFGSNTSAVSETIGKAAGVSGNKAGSLLAMAAPLVLGVLGQRVTQNGLSAADLGNTLKSEAPGFQRFLPAGLGSMLGGVPSAVAAAPAKVASAGNRWLLPLVLLALLAIGLLWFFNRAKAPVGDAVQTATSAVSNAGTSAAAALGDFFKTKLPNGVELNIPQLGVENKLIGFLNDSSKPVDTTTWFNFDRLLFDTGQATLQPSSQEQLNNVAAILKAYPSVHLKIGGYTDSTGDPAANLALSDARARNVMAALVSAGIDPSRLEAKGYGEQYPVGDNSTDAGRAQNRRIAMLVTQK